MEAQDREARLLAAYRHLGGQALREARDAMPASQSTYIELVAAALGLAKRSQANQSMKERGKVNVDLAEFLAACDLAGISPTDALARAMHVIANRDAVLIAAVKDVSHQARTPRPAPSTRVDRIISGLRKASAADHPPGQVADNRGRSAKE